PASKSRRLSYRQGSVWHPQVPFARSIATRRMAPAFLAVALTCSRCYPTLGVDGSLIGIGRRIGGRVERNKHHENAIVVSPSRLGGVLLGWDDISGWRARPGDTRVVQAQSRSAAAQGGRRYGHFRTLWQVPGAR